VDRRFDEVHRIYVRLLRGSLNTVSVTIVFACIILTSIYFLATGAKSELAPDEDLGFFALIGNDQPNASFTQRAVWDKAMAKIVLSYPEVRGTFQVDTPGGAFEGVILRPWDQRSDTASTISTRMQGDMDNGIAGRQIVVFEPPSLPGANGLPFSYVIKTTASAEDLYPIAQELLAAAIKSGKFIFLDSDLKIDQPQSNVLIDRDKAAELGLNMSDVGAALSDALGGNYVNYYSYYDRSYKVIPQVERISRLNPSQLSDYSITSVNGIPVPLSAIATISTTVTPESINHFQQQNSATLGGVAAPGVSQADALATMRKLAAQILPEGYVSDYAGPLRQFVQESNSFLETFGFAVIIIYLALSALFNSFRDPLIILVSVPMSIAGALIFIYLGFGGVSLNIYTEVGLVTLMGLVSKHGILLVDVANTAQLNGKSKREAIEYSASIRLRPILMTTAAMVLGVVPLILSTGAGAAARINMGVVIAGGLAIGTIFTLFVVPAVYMVLSARKTPAVPTAAGRL
jgi:multidrug efflux pump